MLEKVKEIVADSLGADVSTLTAESSFKEDLGADSLDLFEMVMALEEELWKRDSDRGFRTADNNWSSCCILREIKKTGKGKVSV